jgi:hypothetical protein
LQDNVWESIAVQVGDGKDCILRGRDGDGIAKSAVSVSGKVGEPGRCACLNQISGPVMVKIYGDSIRNFAAVESRLGIKKTAQPIAKKSGKGAQEIDTGVAVQVGSRSALFNAEVRLKRCRCKSSAAIVNRQVANKSLDANFAIHYQVWLSIMIRVRKKNAIPQKCSFKPNVMWLGHGESAKAVARKDVKAIERTESCIREAVTIEISHRNGRLVGHDTTKRYWRCDGKIAGAIAKEDFERQTWGQNLTDQNVQMAIIVEVNQCDLKDRVAHGRKARGRERTGAIIDENCNGVRAYVSYHDIGLAIAAEIANRRDLSVRQSIQAKEEE